MRNLATLIVLSSVLVGCSRNENPSEILESPSGEYTIELYSKDLGACCSSRVYANIISSGASFGKLDERLFEIEGGSDVKVIWRSPHNIQVRVCNAKGISYNSDFSNSDYSEYIHVTVENALPQRSNGQVVCPELSSSSG